MKLKAIFVALLCSTGLVQAQEVPPLSTLGEPPIPVDNLMSPEKVELGKMLFWDGRLSGNGDFGCIVCHSPDLGWGTGGPISFGYPICCFVISRAA